MKTYADRHEEESEIKRRKDIYSSKKLQRQMNALNQKQIQRKMDVSQPGDHSEMQADEVAESFMNGNHGAGADILSYHTPEISRMGEGEGMQTSDAFDQQLESTKGQGRPLDEGLKSELEEHTGKDLSDVKVHTGNTADELNKKVASQAFATGNEIQFGAGRYDPGSEQGKKLIAHEVAHTVQQGEGIQIKIMKKDGDPPVYYTYRNITPFVPNEFIALSSYWYGMVNNYFNVTIGSPATYDRLIKNEDETDKLFYLIWQQRPAAVPNENADDKRYHYVVSDPIVHLLEFNCNETTNGNTEEKTLYYEVTFGRGDNGPVFPETSDILINFIKEEDANKQPLKDKKAKKKAELKSASSMPYVDPVTTDGKMLKLIKNTISSGNLNSPFDKSFPDYTALEFASVGDSRQAAFLKSNRGIPAKNDLVRFAYDQYKIYKDYPVDKDNSRVVNGSVSDYYATDVIEVYWWRKSPPDKYMITVRFRDSLSGEIDKESGKKSVEAVVLDAMMITNVKPSDLSGYTQESASKDYTDARLEEDMNLLVHYPKHVAANIIGANDISDERERTIVKFVAYQLVNYDNYSPISIPFKDTSSGSFGFGKLYLNADAGVGKVLFRNSEFDLVIPVPQPAGDIKYCYYSFNIEDVDENATVSPLPNEDAAATARRGRKTVNVTVKRVGEKGNKEIEADNAGNFNLKKIPGYPVVYSEKAAKEFVKLRYDYLNKSKAALDYTSEIMFIDSLSKAIKAAISTEWFKNNYGINILNSAAEAKAASAYSTDPNKLAVYEISEDNRVSETDQPENVQPGVDEKSGTDVIAEKYNAELATGIFKSLVEYQTRMSQDAITKGEPPRKKVYDLYIGVKTWTAEEMLILECALQTMPQQFVSMLSGASFIRQQRSLVKGMFDAAAGLTNSQAKTIILFDSAFYYPENSGFFVGGPSAVHSWSMLPIVHEIGHLISGKTFTTTTKSGNTILKKTDYFLNSFSAYIGLLSTGNGQFMAPTNYGRSNGGKDWGEIFADSFMLFNLDPDYLLNYYPEIYWWFDSLRANSTPPDSAKMKKQIDDKKLKGTLHIK